MKKSETSKIKELAWDYFSLYIRIRDNFQCVICHSRYEDGAIQQAGHVIPRGKAILKFDEKNVNCQCIICNQSHNDRPKEYCSWFIRKYGEKLFLEYSDKSFQNKIYKINNNDILETYKEKLENMDLKDFEIEKLTDLNKRYHKLFTK